MALQRAVGWGLRATVGLHPCPALQTASTGAGVRTLSVYIAGQGRVPVTRKQDVSLASLGGEAITAALGDAGLDSSAPQALYVGNMMSGMLSRQQHLGPLLADAAGLKHVEAATAEACCGAGGAALRWGYMAVKSGCVETCVVAGVEMMTHQAAEAVTQGLATASHWPTEGSQGETFVSLNGLLMKLYMERYGVPHSAFAPFAMTAHDNANRSPHAVFHKKKLGFEAYETAMTVTEPIQLFDASPTCDGAAAVVLTSNKSLAAKGVEIASSAAASDTLPVSQRPEPLHLPAVENSARKALAEAGVGHSDVDIFELHDAYTSMACLCLESAGFVPPGEGAAFASDGHIALDGTLPIATFGGLKARGHPVGATGVYQAAEMFLQLTNRAGNNQVNNANVALIQNIGGSGASVFAHVLKPI